MPSSLTTRQQEVLTFLRAFSANHGYPPTLCDIQRQFGFRSRNSATCHLKALGKKGYLVSDRFTSRGIRLLGEPAATTPTVQRLANQGVLFTFGSHSTTLTQAEASDLALKLLDTAKPLAG